MALHRETLASMRNDVRQRKPNASAEMINRELNRAVRDVCQKIPWSDLQKQGAIYLANAYSTGAITTTPGSRQITGVGTNWPTTDGLDAILRSMVPDTGMQEFEVDPNAERAKLMVGQWVIVDFDTENREAVAVEELTELGFWGRCALTHDAGARVCRSSLSGRQIGSGVGMYTVKSVVDPGTIMLETPWAGSSITAGSYRIVQMLVSIDETAYRLLECYDSVQGSPLDCDHYRFADIMRSDPQLTSSGDPQVAVPAPPGPGGVARWMIHPVQYSERALGIVYASMWPEMRQDEDRPPSGINPSVFVDMARSEVLRTKVVSSSGKADPFYAPDVAEVYAKQAAAMLEQAIQDDEARAGKTLRTWEEDPIGNDVYWQKHAAWPDR